MTETKRVLRRPENVERAVRSVSNGPVTVVVDDPAGNGDGVVLRGNRRQRRAAAARAPARST